MWLHPRRHRAGMVGEEPGTKPVGAVGASQEHPARGRGHRRLFNTKSLPRGFPGGCATGLVLSPSGS